MSSNVPYYAHTYDLSYGIVTVGVPNISIQSPTVGAIITAA